MIRLGPKKYMLVSGDPTEPKYTHQSLIFFSFLKKVRKTLILVLDYFCLNVRTELTKML
jgi:hypothetical protein